MQKRLEPERKVMNEEFVDNEDGNFATKSKDKVASLCFFLGSLLFTIDGIGYCIEQLSWHRISSVSHWQRVYAFLEQHAQSAQIGIVMSSVILLSSREV
jgi:hypothetical protein